MQIRAAITSRSIKDGFILKSPVLDEELQVSDDGDDWFDSDDWWWLMIIMMMLVVSIVLLFITATCFIIIPTISRDDDETGGCDEKLYRFHLHVWPYDKVWWRGEGEQSFCNRSQRVNVLEDRYLPSTALKQESYNVKRRDQRQTEIGFRSSC